ncbi:SDR family oxidoreductase [Streptomyces lydicus]|uniref:SDR family oxidoreductase n=1 Tax=Streptomyces lydicus TaxID=47763 RepID=UPI0009987B1B|nr:SDR family oxidoreductase [Streptomyces lydicus]
MPRLLAHGEGAILNTSSINARPPFPMVRGSSAAQATLSTLTKALSDEFAPRDVRVNAVAAVAFLDSPRPGNITGAEFVIDGARSRPSDGRPSEPGWWPGQSAAIGRRASRP